jgi:hypothetical protein
MHGAALLGNLREILKTRCGIRGLERDVQRMLVAGITTDVEDDVVGDSEESRAKRSAAMGRQRRQGTGKDQTGCVLSRLAVVEPAIAVAKDRIDVPVIETSECLPIGQSGDDKRLVACLRGDRGLLVAKQVWHGGVPVRDR